MTLKILSRLGALACVFVCAGAFLPAQNCSVTYTSLNFGTYTGTVLDSASTAKISCTNGSWTLGLNAGNGSGATITNRILTGPGGAKLNYNLFQEASRTTVWGNTTSTQESGSGSTTLTVYGRVLASQYPVPGTYTDTISSATNSFSVTSTVQATCSISATPMAFGTYSANAVNSTSNISVTCTNTTVYNVGLNAGNTSGATVNNRSMTGPNAAKLGYKLFRDSARTLNWGNSAGSDTLSGSGNGTQQNLAVYGQIPAGQFVNPGSYADTITATITY